MTTSLSKALRGVLIWPIFGVLLSAVLVAAVARLLLAQGNGPVYQESVPLEMSWNRGDNHYGPNFIHLESPCMHQRSLRSAVQFTTEVSVLEGRFPS